jgi:hypothetical protein
MLITHSFKQRLGRRVLLGVDEAPEVAGTGFPGGFACEPLEAAGTEGTGCALGKARSKAGSRTFLAA